MRRWSFFIFLCIFYFTACIKDKPTVITPSSVSISANHKLYITNEGNFMYNNASVTFYNPDTKEVVSDIFKTQNPGYTLGDVCQSIIKMMNDYYLVINNSNKIVIVSADDFKVKQTIYGFTSPRYILPVSFVKAYVSDLYANKINIINLTSKQIVGYIPLPGWSEDMLLFYNKAFILNKYQFYCYVVDALQDKVIDSIYVGKYASGIVLDKNEKLWILCSGDNTINDLPKLHRIDPITLNKEKTFTFSSSDNPHHLIIDASRENIFFINNHIYKMNINSTVLPNTPFITNTSNNFYSMYWNNYDNNLYISDAMDYVQNSTIFRYNANGQLVHTFKAGINASGFLGE
ncbi:MAG: hypothetical protein N2203_08025 [Bacteroidia bacterium]|nr:hypothetical protein [Bacteroidia bacterium]